MKKPITTYEIKYPENKQKDNYYSFCEGFNLPPGSTCYVNYNGGQPGAPW